MAAAAVVLLSGCGGSDGANGINGTNGVNGTNGTNGTNGKVLTNATALTPAQWAGLSLTGQVVKVDMSKGTPVVTFSVADGSGTPVIGLAQKSSTGAYPNFTFGMAKLMPSDPVTKYPSRWVSYFVVATPAAGKTAVPIFPEPENDGSMVDNGDGTYTYTFALDLSKAKSYADAATTYDAVHLKADLDDLTYDPNLPHRLIIAIGGSPAGSDVLVKHSANIAYDFVPATGKAPASTDPQRTIVDIASCNACHSDLSLHAPRIPAMHDPKVCVVCHTEQVKYGSGESMPASGNKLVPNGTYAAYGATLRLQNRALPNFPNMVHKIHMGDELYYQGYNQFGVLYNETTYPQPITNCAKCHDGSSAAANKTPQGDNWKNVPSRLACGACHDGIDFATGKGNALGANGQLIGGHVGGAQSSDANCALCHDAAAIATYHIPVTPIDPVIQASQVASGFTNAASIAAFQDNLPAGTSKIAYDISSVTVDANQHAAIKFKILKDGAGVIFNTYSATGKTEMMDNYIGAPSAYVAFSVPQDGISSPADYNGNFSAFLKGIWNGTATGAAAGTLTGPDASGYYTVTMTGVTIPASAKMVTGGIGYTYNQPTIPPLTQTNVPGYPYNAATKIGGVTVAAPNMWKVATGYTGRRLIVENARCNNCHGKLGVFTKFAFHAGHRNDSQSCAFCHNPNKNGNNGWAADSSTYIHGVHAAAKRSVPFTWEARSDTVGPWNITYPGVLSNCEQCHLPDTYNFGAAASASAVPNLLYSTVAAGTYAAPAAGKAALAPYLSTGVNYGAAATLSAAGVFTAAASTTLVNSPITSACFSCHDTAAAMAHMRANGGSIYEARATALAKPEQCLICHGAGKVADIKAVHAN